MITNIIRATTTTGPFSVSEWEKWKQAVDALPQSAMKYGDDGPYMHEYHNYFIKEDDDVSDDNSDK